MSGDSLSLKEHYLRYRYVVRDRRYLRLLHGHFLELPGSDRAVFIRKLKRDAGVITDDTLSVLLSGEWRGRLTASWLTAASRRAQFTAQLVRLLVASDLVYAGQGFCVALAVDGGDVAVAGLNDYLTSWLPRTDCRYDQAWAMAALVCIDNRTDGDHSARFLLPNGLWDRWADSPDLLDEHTRIMEQSLAALGA